VSGGPAEPDDGLLDLFRMEAETNAGALEAGLVALDTGQATKELLEPLMRAAHWATCL